jgi:O-acetyl-ADP-ribose deacetylase (regulator of RNase III)
MPRKVDLILFVIVPDSKRVRFCQPKSAKMSPVRIVDGNLLDATEQYVCHQCNCTTPNARGLAAALFGRFPYADAYSRRKGVRSKPGTIQICGDGAANRFIVNMFAQWSPGKPRGKDTADQRLRNFRQCLSKIAQIPALQSVAFPFNIGCGLAGGNWNDYKAEIEAFAQRTRTDVVLYRMQP